MKKLFLFTFLLVGCDNCEKLPDQELRTKIFMQCLDKVSFVSQKAVFNDQAELISGCENAAYYQSLRGCEE